MDAAATGARATTDELDSGGAPPANLATAPELCPNVSLPLALAPDLLSCYRSWTPQLIAQAISKKDMATQRDHFLDVLHQPLSHFSPQTDSTTSLFQRSNSPKVQWTHQELSLKSRHAQLCHLMSNCDDDDSSLIQSMFSVSMNRFAHATPKQLFAFGSYLPLMSNWSTSSRQWCTASLSESFVAALISDTLSYCDAHRWSGEPGDQALLPAATISHLSSMMMASITSKKQQNSDIESIRYDTQQSLRANVQRGHLQQWCWSPSYSSTAEEVGLVLDCALPVDDTDAELDRAAQLFCELDIDWISSTSSTAATGSHSELTLQPPLHQLVPIDPNIAEPSTLVDPNLPPNAKQDVVPNPRPISISARQQVKNRADLLRLSRRLRSSTVSTATASTAATSAAQPKDKKSSTFLQGKSTHSANRIRQCIHFQFFEGFTQAVRRPVKMRDFF